MGRAWTFDLSLRAKGKGRDSPYFPFKLPLTVWGNLRVFGRFTSYIAVVVNMHAWVQP